MRTGTAGERFYTATDVNHGRVRAAMVAASRRTEPLPLEALGHRGHRTRLLLEAQADLAATFPERTPMPRRTLKPEDHTMTMAPPVVLTAHQYGPHVEPVVDPDNPPLTRPLIGAVCSVDRGTLLGEPPTAKPRRPTMHDRPTSGASVFVSYELLASLLDLPAGVAIRRVLPSDVGLLEDGLELVLVDDADRLPYTAPGARVTRIALDDVRILTAEDVDPEARELVAFGGRVESALEEAVRLGIVRISDDVNIGALVTGQQGPPPAPAAAEAPPASTGPTVSSEGAGAGSPERPLA